MYVYIKCGPKININIKITINVLSLDMHVWTNALLGIREIK